MIKWILSIISALFCFLFGITKENKAAKVIKKYQEIDKKDDDDDILSKGVKF